MVRRASAYTAVAVAGLLAVGVSACTSSAHVAAPADKTAVPVSSPSASGSTGQVTYECSLADMFFSALNNASYVQSTPNSGDALYAESIDMSQVDYNQLEAASQMGPTPLDDDLAALHLAVLNAKPQPLTLPETVPTPAFSANDGAINAALGEIGNACTAAGFPWGIYALGG